MPNSHAVARPRPFAASTAPIPPHRGLPTPLDVARTLRTIDARYPSAIPPHVLDCHRRLLVEGAITDPWSSTAPLSESAALAADLLDDLERDPATEAATGDARDAALTAHETIARCTRWAWCALAGRARTLGVSNGWKVRACEITERKLDDPQLAASYWASSGWLPARIQPATRALRRLADSTSTLTTADFPLALLASAIGSLGAAHYLLDAAPELSS